VAKAGGGLIGGGTVGGPVGGAVAGPMDGALGGPLGAGPVRGIGGWYNSRAGLGCTSQHFFWLTQNRAINQIYSIMVRHWQIECR
jgi:hypothetical protein